MEIAELLCKTESEEFEFAGITKKKDNEAAGWKSNPKGQFMREDYVSLIYQGRSVDILGN